MLNSVYLTVFLVFSISLKIFAEEIPKGVEAAVVVNNWTQGETTLSTRVFDLAIEGRGFFILEAEDGSLRLTRDGRLSSREDGILINSRYELPVLDLDLNHISFVQDNSRLLISVEPNYDGTIKLIYSEGTTGYAGTIALAIFVHPHKLIRIKTHLFKASSEQKLYVTKANNGVIGRIAGSMTESLDASVYAENGYFD